MPSIHIELFEGRTSEQKSKLASEITRVTCEILGSNPGDVDIQFRDVKRSDWATGGVLWSEKK